MFKSLQKYFGNGLSEEEVAKNRDWVDALDDDPEIQEMCRRNEWTRLLWFLYPEYKNYIQAPENKADWALWLLIRELWLADSRELFMTVLENVHGRPYVHQGDDTFLLINNNLLAFVPEELLV